MARFLVLSCLFYASLHYISGGSFPLQAGAVPHPGSPAGGPTFSQQVDIFYDRLKKLPVSESTNIFKEYRRTLARELDTERLYVSSYRELESLLDAAVKESIDVLTFFTLPVLRQKSGKAVVIDREILLRLERHYDLHSLFLISAPSADDGSRVHMNFLVTGQGKLIIGYDSNTTIRHPEYSFATGRYGYRELFVMEARTDDRGNDGLFHIKGISSPAEDFEWMKGPLNVNIQSLSLTPGPENQKMILVRYELLGTSTKVIRRIPIEKVQGQNQPAQNEF